MTRMTQKKNRLRHITDGQTEGNKDLTIEEREEPDRQMKTRRKRNLRVSSFRFSKSGAHPSQPVIILRNGNLVWNALLDTGSERTILNYRNFRYIGKEELTDSNMVIRGINGLS